MTLITSSKFLSQFKTGNTASSQIFLAGKKTEKWTDVYFRFIVYKLYLLLWTRQSHLYVTEV